jgi:hypothetical protein
MVKVTGVPPPWSPPTGACEESTRTFPKKGMRSSGLPPDAWIVRNALSIQVSAVDA